MASKVTIYQIAQEVGLDSSTVSLALRGNSKVKQKTRERILAVAKRLNYQPNYLASSLSNGHTRVIGVMLTDMNRFFEESVEAIFELGEAADFTVSVRFCSWDQDRERTGIESFIRSRIDGLIWVPSDYNTPEIAAIDAALHQFGIPTVLLGLAADPESLHCSQVGLNMQRSLQMGIAHLQSLGHREIDLLAATRVTGMFGHMHRRRMTVFRDAFRAQGLDFRDSQFTSVDEEIGGGFEYAIKLSSTPKAAWPTAVFAANDTLARETVKAFRALRIRVPEDISVLGYDVIPGTLGSEITSVNLNVREVGEKAMRILLPHLSTGAGAMKRTVLEVEPDIRIGSTCGKPRTLSGN